MRHPLAVLWRPGDYYAVARDRPPPWLRTLLVWMAPWMGLCTLGQWGGLVLFPPSIPAEGVPLLPAYALYSWLTLTLAAAGLGWVASLLGEAFDGRIDHDAAYAAVAAAVIPAGLAKLVWPWPFGAWLSLLLLGWALWLLYRGFGDVLRLPSSGRLTHLFVSLMGALLIAVAVGWQIRDLIPGAAPAMRMGRLWLI
jgi:hypothetical protein